MLEHNLEYSHKLIAMEVENNFVPRNELYFKWIINKNPTIITNIFFAAIRRQDRWKQLCLRSEYEKLETKYLMTKEKNEQLEKELKLAKEAQPITQVVFLIDLKPN